MVGGLEVRAFASGEEALAAVAGVAPQLIVLDVMMPGMNGPEVLAHLREQGATAGIPVVFMTAKAQPEEVGRLRALGVLDISSHGRSLPAVPRLPPAIAPSTLSNPASGL